MPITQSYARQEREEEIYRFPKPPPFPPLPPPVLDYPGILPKLKPLDTLPRPVPPLPSSAPVRFILGAGV